MDRRCHDSRFRGLYERYSTLVWRSLRYFGVEDCERPDLDQEVWLVVHRRLGSLEDDAHARSWIWSIVRRVVQAHRRTTQRSRRRTRALGDAYSNRVEASLQPRAEARATLSGVVSTLSAPQAEVLMLACHGGLSGPEIADVLGVGVNTVYSRLRLARHNVEQALALLQPADEPPREHRSACLAAVLGTSGTPFAPMNPSPPAWSWTKVASWTLGGFAVAAALIAAVAPRSDDSLGLRRFERVALPSASIRVTPDATPLGVSWTPSTLVSPPPVPTGTLAPRPSDDRGIRRRIESRREVRHHDARDGASEPEPPSPKAQTPLREELAVLTPAREIADTDPRRALKLLEDHRRRFPDSSLWDVRESTRVRALCRLDRAETAARLVERLDTQGRRSAAVESALSSCPVMESPASGHGPDDESPTH